MKQTLQSLNTHGIGTAGVTIGGTALLSAVGAFFALLANPVWLAAFVDEIQHREFGTHCFQISAAFFGIVGALVLALLASYFGRPGTVPSDATIAHDPPP